MEKLWFGSAECLGEKIGYGLLVQISEDGIMHYGVTVEYGGEVAAIPDITLKIGDILALAGLLRRGSVTPVTLLDVIEDWLER